MTSVIYNQKYNHMRSELSRNGTLDKAGDYYLVYNLDQTEQTKKLEGLSGEICNRTADNFFNERKVKGRYTFGEVVAVIDPDEAMINKVLETAGE